MEISDRDILKQLFKAAVDAADPKITLPSNLLHRQKEELL